MRPRHRHPARSRSRAAEKISRPERTVMIDFKAIAKDAHQQYLSLKAKDDAESVTAVAKKSKETNAGSHVLETEIYPLLIDAKDGFHAVGVTGKIEKNYNPQKEDELPHLSISLSSKQGNDATGIEAGMAYFESDGVSIGARVKRLPSDTAIELSTAAPGGCELLIETALKRALALHFEARLQEEQGRPN